MSRRILSPPRVFKRRPSCIPVPYCAPTASLCQPHRTVPPAPHSLPHFPGPDQQASATARPPACEPETTWGIAYPLRECVVPIASPRCVALSGGKDLAVDMPKFGHITFDTIPVSQQIDSWDSLPIHEPSLLPCRILHDKGVWAVSQRVRNGASVCDMLRISQPATHPCGALRWQ